MPSLFHIIDEESLSKNPNLKFDPQNPSAHLQIDHPKFQDLKEGLTPEQIEILETVTQVDGFEVDDDKRVDDDVDMEFIDPDTGELEKFNADEFTLDELGFIDPSNLKKITMEAFNTERLDHINGLIQDRYNELSAKGAELFHKRLVSRLEANNVNALLGGTLYDNVVMESFTQYPTVVNYNVVMEEIDAGKTALAAGGAIIGVTILYKLIKWCLNAWNKNSVASGAIGANIKAIQERKDRLENATDVIKTAQDAFTKAQAKFIAATKDGEGISKKEEKKFRDLITKINSNCPNVSAVISSTDSKLLKMALEIVPQDNMRTSKVKKTSKMLRTPKWQLDRSYIDVGGFSSMSKHEPIGKDSGNPCMNIGMDGKLLPQKEFEELLQSVTDNTRSD